MKLLTILTLWASLLHAGQVTLVWNPAEDTSHYRLYIGSSLDAFSGSLESATPFLTMSTFPGRTYVFKVTAVNPAGESGPSNLLVWTAPNTPMGNQRRPWIQPKP